MMRNSIRRMILTAGAVVLGVTPVVAQEDHHGNGVPAGGQVTWNRQGKSNCAGDDLTRPDRHTIQVLLTVSSNELDVIDRTNEICLQPGPSGSVPQVLDGNACDKGG